MREGRKCAAALVAAAIAGVFSNSIARADSPHYPSVTLVKSVSDPDYLRAIQSTFNLNAADTTNADVISAPPYNLTGNGLLVGVFDPSGYVLNTHQELAGRVEFGDFDLFFYSNHATHVAGTIAASGIEALAKGMAPEVNIRTYSAFSDAGKLGDNNDAMIATNHSYGFLRGWTVLDWGMGPERTWLVDRSLYTNEDPGFGKYDENTANMDAVLHANPRLLSVWSAGNDRVESGEYFSAFTPAGADSYVTYLSAGDEGPGFYRITGGSIPLPPADGNSGTGYDSLPQVQVAKNTLVVGAIDDLTDEGPGRTGVMTNFSNWGPTDDGRMKPDVVGNGVNLFSPIAEANDAYGLNTGTSMAAPNVTGTMVLVMQRLMQVRNTTQHPLSATSKAIAIHTAHDLFTPGPDYMSGYGVLDGEAAVHFIDGTTAANASDHIIEGIYSGSDFTENLESIGGELKATLVWTDVEGPIGSEDVDDHTLALVNDLDVWITDELNNIYRPWTLDPENPADAAVQMGRNFRDNVEQILLSGLPAGSLYTLHVGLSGLLTGDSQDWSLLVSGATIVPEPTTMLALILPIGLLTRSRSRRR